MKFRGCLRFAETGKVILLEKLDSRLATVADFVRKDTVAVDVGTDHGYLICKLVEDGICKYAYATDINEKPLDSAKSLIHELGMEDKIETRLTDGLLGLPEKGIDEVLICGMGGETIISILEKAKWVKSELVHIVLQPMSRSDMLRKWLCKNGFRIDEEKAVEVEEHLYTVMSVYFSGDEQIPDDMYCIIGELSNNTDKTAIKYIRWQASIQRSVAKGLMRSSAGKNAALHRMSMADMLDEQADELEKEL